MAYPLFRFITQPKRPLTKTNRMCSDKSCIGDPAGTRTPDPLLKRQLLCQLSYWIDCLFTRVAAGIVWLGRLDSNQRMRESKSLALPLGYAPRWKRAGDREKPDPRSFWGGRRGSNPRHPEPQSGALPAELHPPHMPCPHGKFTDLFRSRGSWYARGDSNPWPTA